MNIKAILPQGLNEIIVNGLHQWDYGRKLEIHSADLPALIEVHFACAGMTEAVVRSCAVVNGVAEVTIPDLCLEQTAPIVAWVYEVGETSGVTTKTITLMVTPRAKPQQGEGVPSSFSDKYTEMIAAINEQVAALRAGNVTVSAALKADNATNAENAKYATKADSATKASVADGAPIKTGEVMTFAFGKDNGFGLEEEGVSGFFKLTGQKTIDEESLFCCLIPSLKDRMSLGDKNSFYRAIYARTVHATNLELYSPFQLYNGEALAQGTYQVKVTAYGAEYTAVVHFNGTENHTLLGASTTTVHSLLELVVTASGAVKVYSWSATNDYGQTNVDTIAYRKIW